MEQAVNQFNKGLLSDTHPMVLGNDTLSDALNATFVTMNGNEVVLQNDMGNRRVDNAFLPPGYEPVGMKEYGGIIYVASYNPITGRSLIGSFPSPERKINSLDDESLGCNFGLFNDFIDRAEIGKNGFKFITSDTILYSLTGETSLHAGDKFAIYSSNINDWGNYLTNYNNVNHRVKRRALEQKNNYLTLSVGILNSLNLFVDITKNLKRWNNSTGNGIASTEIKHDDTCSDIYIFNDGYFISKTGFTDGSDYSENDRRLIKERLVNPANTYAYKLVGPLYLKSQLNHILEFSYNISGDKGDKYLHLEINAVIKYNCPDVFGRGNSNDNYLYDGCGEFSNTKIWEPFKFFRKSSTGYRIDNIERNYTYTKPTYDNGLYTTTVKLSLTDTNYTKDLNGKYEYFIGVDSGIPTDQTNNESYFIKTLSSYGEIDLSKLNSGELYLNYFRFFNNIDESDDNNNTTTVSIGIEAYPKLDLKFKYLTIGLADVEDIYEDEIPIEVSNEVYNGKIVKTINWKDYGIEKGKLYKVSFTYSDNLSDSPMNDIIKRKENLSDSDLPEQRWLLTTKLFNDCYNPLSDNFVEDFGERVYNPDTIEYNSNFTNKQKKENKKLYNKLAVKLYVSDSTINIEPPLKEEKIGNLIIKQDPKDKENFKNLIKYSVKRTYTVTKYIPNLLIKNSELYPEFLKLENNLLNIKLSRKKNIIYPSVEIFDKSTLLTTVVDQYTGIFYPSFTYNNNSVKLILYCYSYILSNISNNQSFKNGFVKINSDYFRDNILTNSVSHSGFFVGNYDHHGDPDEHYVGLVCDYPYLTVPTLYEDFSKIVTYSRRIDLDDPKIFDFNNEDVDSFYNSMNSSISSRYTFAYIFSAFNVTGRVTDDNSTDKKDPLILAYVSNFIADRKAGLRVKTENGVKENESVLGYCPITSCKVWWRNGISDNWVLLNSRTGLFGATSSTVLEFKFPFDIEINGTRMYFYIGMEGWTNSIHPVYINGNDPKTLYNALYYGKFTNQLNEEEGSNEGVSGGSSININRKEHENSSPAEERYKDTIKLVTKEA